MIKRVKDLTEGDKAAVCLAHRTGLGSPVLGCISCPLSTRRSIDCLNVPRSTIERRADLLELYRRIKNRRVRIPKGGYRRE